MESRRRLFFVPIIFTFVTLSAAVQNPVPIFISEAGRFKII